MFLLGGDQHVTCGDVRASWKTNTTCKVLSQRRLYDLLPRKIEFRWKSKVSSARVSSQRLNLPFQWMLNLSVEKGFRVTAQSLLPVERTFARGMNHSIIRLAQGGRPRGHCDLRPPNSPVGTIQIAKSYAEYQSCRPSNSPVGTIGRPLDS